jgi:hypothetical protein
MSARTAAQRRWLADHPGWTVVSTERHHRDYAKATNGKGPWMGDELLCGDGSLLPGTSFQIDERIYVRPPKELR